MKPSGGRSMHLRFPLIALLLVVAVAPAVLTEPARAQAPAPVYIAVDGSLLLTLAEPARKVAVANPAIADVQVISPAQLLNFGNASVVTTLINFYVNAI